MVSTVLCCAVFSSENCAVPLDAFKILALSGFSKHKCASWWQGWRWEGWGGSSLCSLVWIILAVLICWKGNLVFDDCS